MRLFRSTRILLSGFQATVIKKATEFVLRQSIFVASGSSNHNNTSVGIG